MGRYLLVPLYSLPVLALTTQYLPTRTTVIYVGYTSEVLFYTAVYQTEVVDDGLFHHLS
eukprot:SAG11_NODE_750_length_7360_cov_7.329522_4_plen_59_part_00